MKNNTQNHTNLAEASLALSLTQAANKGDCPAISLLLSQGANAQSNDSLPLREAAKAGHLGAVRLLLVHSNPMANESEALRDAAKEGHSQVVRTLLPVSDATAKGSSAYYEAKKNGYSDIVEMLAPVSEFKPCKASYLS